MVCKGFVLCPPGAVTYNFANWVFSNVTIIQSVENNLPCFFGITAAAGVAVSQERLPSSASKNTKMAYVWYKQGEVFVGTRRQ